MKQLVTTPRLIWREFGAKDGAFMLELLNSPGWITFIGNRNINTEAEAQAYIDDRLMAYYQENGFGFLMVTLNNIEETPVGICGFIQRDYLEHADFGFAFLPQFMGKGYAHEISLALLPYAKNVLQMEKICAITNLDNLRSIKLLEKINFSFDKVIINEDEELRLFVHDLND